MTHAVSSMLYETWSCYVKIGGEGYRQSYDVM